MGRTCAQASQAHVSEVEAHCLRLLQHPRLHQHLYQHRPCLRMHWRLRQPNGQRTRLHWPRQTGSSNRQLLLHQLLVRQYPSWEQLEQTGWLKQLLHQT